MPLYLYQCISVSYRFEVKYTWKFFLYSFISPLSQPYPMMQKSPIPGANPSTFLLQSDECFLNHISPKIDSNCNTEGLKEFQKQNSEPLRKNYTAMFFRQQYQWVRFKKPIFCNDVMLLPNLWNSCLEDK